MRLSESKQISLVCCYCPDLCSLSDHWTLSLKLNILDARATEKRKVEKEKSKGEKAMEKAVASFMKYQSEMEERF